MSVTVAEDKIRKIETYIKGYVKGASFGADIDDVPWMLTDGLNGQPGPYMNFSTMKGVTKIFWAGQFSKMNKTAPSGTVVLVDTGVGDKGGTLWMGVLFHECGHAATDKLGKNSEPAAYTVELLSLLDHVTANPGAADEVKTFVLDRRKNKQHTGFLAGYEDRAKQAYATLSGSAL